MVLHRCSGCAGDAHSLQCPTCAKLGLPSTFFCSQQCFQKNWGTHRKAHKVVTHNPFPSYDYTGELRAVYPLSGRRVVPESIARPCYSESGIAEDERKLARSSRIEVLKDDDIEQMRVVCKLAREVLDEGVKAIAPGVTTDEIDRVVHEATVERECYPSPLNYFHFPKSCCTSVNEVICHGIPDLYKLKPVDIVNLDVTCYHRGYHGDLNETHFVSEEAKTPENKRLLNVTRECLRRAINIVRPGTLYREVGDVIERHAHSNGLGVVRTYTGHGIHRLFHTSPNVPHYAKNKAPGSMKEGHVFTIEPMITAGSFRDVTWPDNWTAATADGKNSAQFEHTLLVTKNGCEVLTKRGRWDFVLDGLEEEAALK